MKLLQKTTLTYIILSAAAFLIAGIVIFFTLSVTLEEQISERMTGVKDQVIRNIQQSVVYSNDPPYLVIKEVPKKVSQPDKFTDTLIFDPYEQEEIPFRQLLSNISIDNKNYQIIIRNTLVEKSDILITIIIVICSVFSLLLAALFYLNRKLSLKIWKPFYQMLDDLKKFSQENISFTISGNSDINEFIELKSTLQLLTNKVISDYNSLKSFTIDVSHEIQTPLSVIQSKLELLIQDKNLTEEQAEIIQSAFSAASRFAKLSRSLIMLTKIENRQFPDLEQINFSSLLTDLIKNSEEAAYEKSLEIEHNIKPDCFQSANCYLVESLFNNLIGNAIRHSKTPGRIYISLDNNKLIIINPGKPLNVSPDILFNRFYKADQASDSLGLGLSIVKKICEVNNWKIDYSAVEDQHTVTVIF